MGRRGKGMLVGEKRDHDGERGNKIMEKRKEGEK